MAELGARARKADQIRQPAGRAAHHRRSEPGGQTAWMEEGRMRYRALAIALLASLMAACATTAPPPDQRDPVDPWEPYNRNMYKFNRTLDKAVLRPVAKGYAAVVPDPAETGITNFFDNLLSLQTIVNLLLQGRPAESVEMTVRCAMDWRNFPTATPTSSGGGPSTVASGAWRSASSSAVPMHCRARSSCRKPTTSTCSSATPGCRTASSRSPANRPHRITSRSSRTTIGMTATRPKIPGNNQPLDARLRSCSLSSRLRNRMCAGVISSSSSSDRNSNACSRLIRTGGVSSSASSLPAARTLDSFLAFKGLTTRSFARL